jgi:5'-phosphate synthase pdxT subunit
VKPRLGVLALQGDVQEHLEALERCGTQPVRVRDARDLEGLDGLVIPGGESSVIGMLLERYGLLEPVRERLRTGLPAYGTCAGLILMARDVEESPLPRIGCLDVAVRRNAFGRQVDSFEADLEVPALGEPPFRGVFIRAPIILSVGDGVEVLGRIAEGPVLVRQGPLLASAFHPELTGDLRLHEYFVEMTRQ